MKFQLRFFILSALLYFFLDKSSGFAGNDRVLREEEPTSDGLEMIAARMQELSQSLDRMPEPPAMNQTIEIPNLNQNLSRKKKGISPNDPENKLPLPEKEEA